MGCSPPPARHASPVVLAGPCRQTGWVMEMEREGTGGERGMLGPGGTGEEGRSQSETAAGSRSA